MRFWEKPWVAWLVWIVVAVLSLALSGGGALATRRDGIVGHFWASSESISAELREMTSDAQVMASIARKYGAANETYIESVEAGVEALNDALREQKAPTSLRQASDALTSALENLYSNLTGLALNETDLSDARYQYKNYQAALLRISHDAYNDQATLFNGELAAFPANMTGALRGVKALELFS